MGRPEVLDERAMQLADAQIPELAGSAVKRAYYRALTISGTVVEAVDGKLVETSIEGSRRVLGDLPPSTPVIPGSKRVRSRSV